MRNLDRTSLQERTPFECELEIEEDSGQFSVMWKDRRDPLSIQ